MRHFRPAAVLGVLGLVAAGDAPAADTARQSRTSLGEAIREALDATPQLLSGVTGVSRPQDDLYADEIARDLDLLDRTAPRLFDPARRGIGPPDAPPRIAIFTREGCAACAAALDDLRRLAQKLGFRATVFDITQDTGLARELGLDTAPSYVMRDRILRGAMPAIVLERYLTD